MIDLFSNLSELNISEIKIKVLNNEFGIKTIEDLLEFYPRKYSICHHISSLDRLSSEFINQEIIITGKIGKYVKTQKMLINKISDSTGYVKLIWFKKYESVSTYLKENNTYSLTGELTYFDNIYTIVHPVLYKNNIINNNEKILSHYSFTERAKKANINNRFIRTITNNIFNIIKDIHENIPDDICKKYHLLSRYESLKNIHNPQSYDILRQAQRRLKFEELFFEQLKLLQTYKIKHHKNKGVILNKITITQSFIKNDLPFELTSSQKKVMNEIYKDLNTGYQMNRLLQGDVGSGKTIIAFLSMMIAVENGYQAILMAPTELLAEQHFNNFIKYNEKLNMRIEILTGSTKSSKRKQILNDINNGNIDILIGTHSLTNNEIKYKSLGLIIIDEQHRFGVKQRSQLSTNNSDILPHSLVMSATPIPRTLAMTIYGDADVSIIDEKPKNRKSVKTLHYYQSQRLKIFQFIKNQLDLNHQIYVIYPLIEESKKLDLNDLMNGYESLKRYFPNTNIGVVHGQMKTIDKDKEMEMFVKGVTKILVSTTVIEVGINVPNATLIIIENSERFGLAQLHQLRGRVGRGDYQSYCLLVTDNKLTNIGRERIKALLTNEDGFELANIDLKLRGAGDMLGIKQSGITNYKIADLSTDEAILNCARLEAKNIISNNKLTDELKTEINENFGNIV